MKNLNSSDVDKSSSVTFEICGNSKFLSRCLFVTVFHEYLSTKIPRYIHYNSRNPSLTFLLQCSFLIFHLTFLPYLDQIFSGFRFFSSPEKCFSGGKKSWSHENFRISCRKPPHAERNSARNPVLGRVFGFSYRPCQTA